MKNSRGCGADKGEMQHYFNMFASLDYDGFSKGYRHAEPNVPEHKIAVAFTQGDTNGDGRISFKELRKMTEDMDGSGSGSESGSESDDRRDQEALEYWKKFSKKGEDGRIMDRRGFVDAYNTASPGVSTREVRTAWDMADRNQDKNLSR